MQIALGTKYSLNDQVTFGIEFNLNAAIEDGATQRFDDACFRFGCSIEL